MRSQTARQALESKIVSCPHGIVAHILHDPFGLLTLPYRARIYRMANHFTEAWKAEPADPPRAVAPF